MRYYCYIATLILLSACFGKRPTHTFVPFTVEIPGTYVAMEYGQFCLSSDTLTINHYSQFDNTYEIDEHVTFQRRWYSLQYDRQSEWNQFTSVLDYQSRTLNAINGYPNIQCLPNQYALMVNGVRYTKISH